LEIGKEILTAIITSSLVSGLFLYIIKQYSAKWIANEFENRQLKLNYKIKKAEKVETNLLDKQLGIYPELIQLTYRLKNILHDGVQKKFAYEWDPNLRPLGARLTEDLYNYRFFIPSELFEMIHSFKHIVQDAILLVDMHTREDKAFDEDLYKNSIEKFKSISKEAADLFDNIDKSIKLELQSLTQL